MRRSHILITSTTTTKKSVKGELLCEAYCRLGVKFNFWRESAACKRLCQSLSKNRGFIRIYNPYVHALTQERIKLGDPGCEHWGKDGFKVKGESGDSVKFCSLPRNLLLSFWI